MLIFTIFFPLPSPSLANVSFWHSPLVNCRSNRPKVSISIAFFRCIKKISQSVQSCNSSYKFYNQDRNSSVQLSLHFGQPFACLAIFPDGTWQKLLFLDSLLQACPVLRSFSDVECAGKFVLYFHADCSNSRQLVAVYLRKKSTISSPCTYYVMPNCNLMWVHTSP